LIGDLLFASGMREYCVGRYFAAGWLAKDDFAIEFALKEA